MCSIVFINHMLLSYSIERCPFPPKTLITFCSGAAGNQEKIIYIWVVEVAVPAKTVPRVAVRATAIAQVADVIK